MTAITICSDFGAPQNKFNHCFHCFPIYLPWSGGTGCHYLSFLNPFHYRGLECESRKSRNTWSNGQIWPWSREWSRAKANRVLPGERIGHGKQPLPRTQKALHMDITRWSTLKSDWLYSLQPKMEKLYTVSLVYRYCLYINLLWLLAATLMCL